MNKNTDNNDELFSPDEMLSPFDSIKEVDAEGREWWNSKDLATAFEGNMMIYRSTTGKVSVNVLFSNDTFWLSQKRMSELYNVTIPDIVYHLKQINETGEVQLSAAIKKILIPSDNCEDAGTILYNLDAIIAVGYRVNSYEATQFRIWAREVLKEYITKGFVMDDERLKGKNPFGADYFEDLLDRIREIRTSERRYYQKITDIYAECSSDYDPKRPRLKLWKSMRSFGGYKIRRYCQISTSLLKDYNGYKLRKK